MHSYYARINTVFFTAVYSLAAIGVLYGILYRMNEVLLMGIERLPLLSRENSSVSITSLLITCEQWHRQL